MATSLPDFPSFDAHSEPTSVGQRWIKWIQRFENLLVALDSDSSKRRRTLLLHYASPTVQDVYDTLPTPTVGPLEAL